MSGYRARLASSLNALEVAADRYAERHANDRSIADRSPSPASEGSPAPVSSSITSTDILRIRIILQGCELDASSSLKFCEPPSPSSSSIHTMIGYIPALTGDPCNDHIAGLLSVLQNHENDLRTALLDEQRPDARTLRALLKDVIQKEEEITKFIRLSWERERLIAGSPMVVNTARFFRRRQRLAAASDTLPWYLLVAALKVMCKNSEANCNFVLRVANGMISDFTKDDGGRSAEGRVIAIRTKSKTVLPSQVGPVIDWLDLSPPCIPYVCCPDCYAIYPPSAPNPPSHCTRFAKPDDDSPCGSPLFNATKPDKPLRTMPYYGIANWLGNLLCRREIEDAIDASRRSGRPSGSPDDYIHDTWDSKDIREMPDPLTGRPFIDFDDDELHIIVRLSEDGFHPFGKRPGGKSISVGAMIMVCMNLPAALRERKDNICNLAAIPGPGSPSLDEMNGPLRVVVDELLALAGEDGVFITRTSRFPFGRKVRVLLVPETADQPATRQLCGFSAATSTHFCPYCTLTYQERNNIDYKSWTPRRWKVEYEYAKAWYKASTEKERIQLFEAHGLRWSELHRLWYWNPFLFALPDASHMFACIFRHHLRGIFGMSIRVQDDNGSAEDQVFSEAWQVLTRGASSIFERLSSLALTRLVDHIQQATPAAVQVDGRWTKEKRVRFLKSYRVSQHWFALDDSGKEVPGPACPGLLTAHDVSQLKSAALTRTGATKLTRDDITPSVAWEYFSTRSKSTIEKDLDRSALIALADSCLEPEEGEPFDSLTLVALRDKIHQARMNADILDENGKVRAKDAGPRLRANPKAKAVLGKHRLADLRSVIQQLKKPSWLPVPTRRPGDPAEGSLKSSATRRLAELYLPISLIREWGPCPKGSRERQLLENYMHLISASLLAHKRKTRRSTIRRFHREAHLYLTTRASLFSDVSVTPYEHLMLHFSWFLERLGPMHAWQQLLMEQRNGDLQKIPTNYKFGELEQTMFHGFGQEQTLRVVFGEELPKIRPDFAGVTEAYNRRFSKDVRATLRDHHIPVDENFQILGHPGYWEDQITTVLAQDSREYQLLEAWIRARGDKPVRVAPQVLQHKAVTFLGQRFQAKGARSEGDTGIVYRDGRQAEDGVEEGLHSTWTAGQILSIFSHNRESHGRPIGETFFVVQPYSNLSDMDARRDFFREFDVWGGRLYYADPARAPSPVLVCASDVVCQLASMPMNIVGIHADCVLVIPTEI